MNDAIVLGGGIMGAAAAIRLAEAGMDVTLVEAGSLGRGASGANAGTLSLQIKRTALMPYALRGHALWRQAGAKVGFAERGGLTLAFTESEAALLTERMSARRAAGADITLISGPEARAREPGLGEAVTLASWCREDGYANSNLTGAYYRALLVRANVKVREQCRIETLTAGDASVAIVDDRGNVHRGRRLLIAAGAWSAPLAAQLDVALPIRIRVNTVSVTERLPRIFRSVIGHATGLLTLKQSTNGTILIGGGWQGQGSPETGGEVQHETLIDNLRLASFAIPEMRAARLVRSWTGFEANTPDLMPLAGLLPGHANVFVLAAVRGGYTIGPYIGRLMGDLMLGHDPELPLFDPARFMEKLHVG